ncbi:MAG: hypothetical protein QXK74_07220 [Candidatus Nitrosocaldaceae archaeon]
MALGISLTVMSIVIGIIVGAVVLTQLTPIAQTMATCPNDSSASGLADVLQDACNIFVNFGGVIVVVSILIGLVVYLRFWR